MEIFISWSGEKGEEIANELREWFPKAIQATRPWVSSSDIKSGGRWLSEVTNKLESINFGIICLTPESINSNWVLFEAGALSKSIKNSYVCPLIFGLEKSDIKGPLSQFQIRLFNKVDFFKLVQSINSVLDDISLSDAHLEEVFEIWWPNLEVRINNILQSHLDSSVPIREGSDILKEILDKVRGIETHLFSHQSSNEESEVEFDEEYLRRLIYIDPLTELGNRKRLSEIIDNNIEVKQAFSILLIDLDNFKIVNDLYGHEVGDNLLRSIAKRLYEVDSGGGELTRLGGDEFGLLVKGVINKDSLNDLANKILQKILEPTLLEGNELIISASIGISTYPKNASDMNAIMAGADMAMYKAKEEGGNTVKYIGDFDK